jgi:hypothetical protein
VGGTARPLIGLIGWRGGRIRGGFWSMSMLPGCCFLFPLELMGDPGDEIGSYVEDGGRRRLGCLDHVAWRQMEAGGESVSRAHVACYN